MKCQKWGKDTSLDTPTRKGTDHKELQKTNDGTICAINKPLQWYVTKTKTCVHESMLIQMMEYVGKWREGTNVPKDHQKWFSFSWQNQQNTFPFFPQDFSHPTVFVVNRSVGIFSLYSTGQHIALSHGLWDDHWLSN